MINEIIKFSRRSFTANDKRCKKFLHERYSLNEEQADEGTIEIKEICNDVMNKLFCSDIKIDSKSDLINLIKQYNMISSAKIIEYLENKYEKDEKVSRV